MIKQLSKSVLRIQYASNLRVHQKSFDDAKKLLNPVAPTLALLGDIGRPDCDKTMDFMKWCTDNYSYIYWVPGHTELASYEKKRPWFYQCDAIQEQLAAKNILRVIFGSKRDIYLSTPSVQIVMGTLWSLNKPTNGILTYCKTKGTTDMTSEDVKTCLEADMDWLLLRTAKSHVPVVWLSYCSPLRHFSNFHSPVVLNHPKLLASIMGTHVLPISVSGKLLGQPWTGLNMYEYYNYNTEAFWEYDESRGAKGPGNSGETISSFESSIRDMLLSPAHVTKPLVF